MLSCTTPIFSKSPRTDLHHPARHGEDAHDERDARRRVAARHLAPHPEQDGQRAGRDEQGAVHDRQHEADSGDQAERIEEGLRVRPRSNPAPPSAPLAPRAKSFTVRMLV